VIIWIESQTTWAIVILGFALSYALALVVFAAAIMASRRRFATELKATTPVMLTPLSVIAGLLIAFLASRVWSNLDRAHTLVAQEASAIRESVILGGAFPAGTRAALNAALKDYLHFVQTEDWPAMGEGRAQLRPLPAHLTEAMHIVLDYVPTEPGQGIAQQRTVVALEQALEARRNRIVLSQAVIAPIQWIVIITLVGLVLWTVAMVHVDRPTTVAINLFIFSTAVAVCLALLLVNDRPFAAGGNTVQPIALQQIIPD
jgi:hypothetical protein